MNKVGLKAHKNGRSLLTANLSWKGKLCSEAKIRSHVVTLDSPKKNGGDDRGPSPSELFLAALGSCMMTNISRISSRMKINLKDVHMKVSGIKEYNEHPSSFTSLDIDVYINAENADIKNLKDY